MQEREPPYHGGEVPPGICTPPYHGGICTSWYTHPPPSSRVHLSCTRASTRLPAHSR